jgi:hypothetical protein
MAGVMVFIPTDRSTWQAAASGDVAAHAPTEALMEAFDITDAEEAEYAAMSVASVAALTRHGSRFVLGAEVSPAQVDDSDDTGNGEVVVRGLRRAQIVSWFCEELPDDPRVRSAAQEARGLGVDDAWHLDEVQALIGTHALLWHAAEELED